MLMHQMEAEQTSKLQELIWASAFQHGSLRDATVPRDVWWAHRKCGPRTTSRKALHTENQLSENLQVSLACLTRWRLRGEAQRYIKVGSLVRYRPEDIEGWLERTP
jgi:hypothetical protein